jgi:uncharacterized protein involved in outer membrane biogenesis
MKRRVQMKKLLIAALVIVVLVVVALFLLVSNLDKLVAKGVEKFGSDATQTQVSVSGVDISLREGRGSIKGLRVASPEGFDARTALSLDDITVAIDVKSVQKDPVVIDEIRIKAPVVNAELTQSGESNIDVLRKRVEAYAGKSSGESGSSGKAAKKLRIMRFVFEEGRIEVDASGLGIEKKTIVLPEIGLNDIGGATGATPEEIAKEILTAVARRTSSEIAGSGIDGLIKAKLGGSAADEAKGVLEKVFK